MANYKGLEQIYSVYQFKKLLLQCLGLVTMLAACEQPTTFVPGFTDRFVSHSEDSYSQANQVLQADYLFVLDYSFSMSDGNASQSSKLQQLFDSMNDFTSELETKNIDYNVGFVKGTTHAGSASTIATGFVSPFITKSTSGSGLNASILSQVQNVGGALEENTNYLLEASLRVMKNQEASFSRPAAQLVYVFVSDSDDLSDKNSRISGAKDVNYYISQLKTFKTDPAYISARSFTAGVALNCALQNTWDIAGARIAAVAQGVDSMSTAPGCIYTPMADSLKDLARDVTKTTGRFVLRGKPVPASIRIFENNVEIAASGNWSYAAATNEVVFVSGHEPAPSSQLRIEYSMIYTLAKTPRADTIAVTVNGASVAKDATNGWTYVAAENRIEFHGTAQPPQDADVRVTYTLQ